MLGAETYERLVEKQIIEVAPLAYMRGRTLDDSFIILDEAQNTTPEQMKMFLTLSLIHISYENTIGAKDSAVTEIRKAETDALNNVEASAGPAASAAADAAAAGAKEKTEKAIQEVKDVYKRQGQEREPGRTTAQRESGNAGRTGEHSSGSRREDDRSAGSLRAGMEGRKEPDEASPAGDAGRDKAGAPVSYTHLWKSTVKQAIKERFPNGFERNGWTCLLYTSRCV